MNRTLQSPYLEDASEARVVLSLRGLSKRFGDVNAVSDVSLEIRAGEVLGLLGPNGAGKSTLVGMILGLVKPSAGQIVFHDVKRSHIGAIIENPAFYPFLSGRDNLRAIARIAGGVDDGEIMRLIDLVGLTRAARRKYGTYSLGMKQRLGLASTLLAGPQIIILDEPTNGLDPAGQQEIREILPRLATPDRAVIVTSHQLHDVEQVAVRVAILQDGRLRTSGRLAELLGDTTVIELRVADPRRALDLLRRLPGVESVSLSDEMIQVRAAGGSTVAISRALAEAGLFVESLAQKRGSLEDLFFEVTRRKDKE